jgi:hypothetical protein
LVEDGDGCVVTFASVVFDEVVRHRLSIEL